MDKNIAIEEVNNKESICYAVSHTRRERKLLKVLVRVIVPALIIMAIIVLSDLMFYGKSYNFTNLKAIIVLAFVGFISSAIINIWVKGMTKLYDIK